MESPVQTAPAPAVPSLPVPTLAVLTPPVPAPAATTPTPAAPTPVVPPPVEELTVLRPIETPAPAAASEPLAVLSPPPAAPAVPTPATAPARATNGAKPQPKAQPKPRRLPVLLRPEDVEFKDWTYDREAEQARAGLQKADVLGIVWIGGVLLMIGFILFRLLKTRPVVGEGLMVLGGIGLMAAGYLFLKLKKKPDETLCVQCHGALGLMHTIPTERDCKANNYTRQPSGHAYRLENGPTPKVWEIHKKWHVCKTCKRYFLAEKESLDFVGAAKADMEKREALYAEAAAAAAAGPTPQPPPVLM